VFEDICFHCAGETAGWQQRDGAQNIGEESRLDTRQKRHRARDVAESQRETEGLSITEIKTERHIDRDRQSESMRVRDRLRQTDSETARGTQTGRVGEGITLRQSNRGSLCVKADLCSGV